MANKSRLSIAKSKIEAFFESSGRRVFTPTTIESIVSTKGAEWRLALSTTAKQFAEFMLDKSKLTKVDLKFPTQTSTRYIWGKESEDIVFDLALSLRQGSYFSHYTAMFFHDLTEQIPKSIYVTFEQPDKKRDSKLSQQAIDEAFKGKVRETSNIAYYKDYKIVLLNGGYTGHTGVLNQQKYPVTTLERTLIDAAVRPVYSGGVLEVVKAYKNAKDKVQVNKLKAYLKQMNFIYPYFQVIGFYLELAGVPEKRISYLENAFEKTFDFYLTHDIQEKSYSDRWKLYYPTYVTKEVWT